MLTRGSKPWVGRIGTLSMSSCLKLPTIHRARRATLSRGRDSCDIRLPSNETSGVISSIRSRRCISGNTLRQWNTAATIPTVNSCCQSLLNMSRSGCSFGFSSSTTPYVQLSSRDIRTRPENLGSRSSSLRR
jgi:hypothetical protein